MPLYSVQADCPVTEYEAKDEMEAIEKYSENWKVHYKFVTAEKIEN